MIWWTIGSLLIFTIYFVLTFIWMKYTFKYQRTVTYYTFSHELKKDRKSLMHFFEVAMSILLIVGFIITLISQIQIWILKGKEGWE